MLSTAVDRYLAARRAVGFQLRDTEEILRDFVAFAAGKADTHICNRTVLEWIRSRNSSPLRNDVRLRTVVLLYSTLFGLLASTGLRISEALKLRIEDVTPDGLLIRNTKFRKNRLLPLHTTTKERLDGYLALRLREVGSCPFVFVSIRGCKLHQTTVRGVFPPTGLLTGCCTAQR